MSDPRDSITWAELEALQQTRRKPPPGIHDWDDFAGREEIVRDNGRTVRIVYKHKPDPPPTYPKEPKNRRAPGWSADPSIIRREITPERKAELENDPEYLKRKARLLERKIAEEQRLRRAFERDELVDMNRELVALRRRINHQ